MKTKNILEKCKKDFSFNRLILSIFFSIISIITFLYCEIAKIKKEVKIELTDVTYFETISISDNDYKMKDLLELSDDGKYFSENNLSFYITNNDSLSIVADKEFDIYIDDEKKDVTSNDRYIFDTSVDKYRIAINTLNNVSKFIIVLLFVFFSCLYYLLIKIIQLFFERIYSNKFDIKLYLLTMISLFVIYYFNFRTLVNLFGFLSGFIIVFILLYFVIKYKNSKFFNYHYNYLLIAIFIGISIMFINPPVNVLDEANHFSKVNDQFIIKGDMSFDELGRFYTFQSKELTDFIRKYENNVFSHVKKTYLMNSYEDYVSYESNESIVYSYGTYLSNQLAYIPAMLVVHGAKLLNANIYLIFMLGRFINFVIFVLVCYYSLKIISKYKYLMFIICTFTILLQQGMGMNQDWLNNCSLILLFSYILYLIFEKKNISKYDYLFLCLISICLAFSKTVYTAFVFLFIFVPNKKIDKSIIRAYAKKILLILFAAGMTLLSYKFSSLFFEVPINKTFPTDYYSVSYSLSHPIWFIEIILKSFLKNGHLYFLLSYFKDFGWYKVSFPHLVSLFFAFVYVVLIIIQPKEEFKNNIFELVFKIINLLLFMFVSVLIASSLLFGYTKFGMTTIDGLQGRYFLPAIFSAYLFLNNKFFKIDNDKLLKICSFIVIFINAFSVVYMIYGFYY